MAERSRRSSSRGGAAASSASATAAAGAGAAAGTSAAAGAEAIDAAKRCRKLFAGLAGAAAGALQCARSAETARQIEDGHTRTALNKRDRGGVTHLRAGLGSAPSLHSDSSSSDDNGLYSSSPSSSSSSLLRARGR